jgi:hypothetical protein
MTLPLAIALFLLPIPFSIHGATEQNPNLVGDKSVVIVPELPELAAVPPDTVIAAQSGRARLTLGWLRQAYERGELPDLDEEERRVAEVNWRTRLALRQSAKPTPDTCTPVGRFTDLTLEQGQTIGFQGGPIQVLNGEPGGSAFNVVTFDPVLGKSLDVQVPGVAVRIRSADPSRPASLCLDNPP